MVTTTAGAGSSATFNATTIARRRWKSTTVATETGHHASCCDRRHADRRSPQLKTARPIRHHLPPAAGRHAGRTGETGLYGFGLFSPVAAISAVRVAPARQEGCTMPRRGPLPKDPATRARRNAVVPVRVVQAAAAPQPHLPPLMVSYIDADGQPRSKRIAWPAITREWWAMWANSPLAAEFTSTDWSELRDTARLHAEYWRGNLKVASELRLRVAKFAATPEDRARLRIQFADADEKDEKRAARSATPDPYAGLHAVD